MTTRKKIGASVTHSLHSRDQKTLEEWNFSKWIGAALKAPTYYPS